MVEGPDGDQAHRDVVRHPGGVGVLPVDGDHILLVEQFRVAVGAPILEIPAGKLDSPEEEPATAAARELEEEMGFRPSGLEPLGAMWPSPGYTDELIHLFAATGLQAVSRRPDGVEEAHARTVRIPVDEAMASLWRGGIVDAKTQLALLLWAGR